MIYKLELTREQLAVLSEALLAMPYGRVYQLVNELQTQVQAQEKQQRQEQEVK